MAGMTDQPCNCRACNACAIIGTAKPIDRQTKAQAEEPPRPKATTKPGLFDEQQEA